MTTKADFGIVTMAFGKDRYWQQARILAMSLRYNMPSVPIAIITDRDTIDTSLFDYRIPVDMSRGVGVRQKVHLDTYSVFERTLFIDSDCVVTRPFESELAEISDFNFTPVCKWYLRKGDRDDYIADLDTVLSKAQALELPKFNGGIYYFDRSEYATKLFSTAKQICDHYQNYGIIEFDAGGPNEETIFSVALACLGYESLYDDKGRLMSPTINVEGRINISPLGGGCDFSPWGERCQPAICHFVRNNVYDHSYRFARRILRAEFNDYSGSFERATSLISDFYYRLLYWSKMKYHLVTSTVSKK